MTNNLFVTGDVVRLKSGGPNMTVITPRDARALVCCAWITSAGATVREGFPPECVEKVIPDNVMIVASEYPTHRHMRNGMVW